MHHPGIWVLGGVDERNDWELREELTSDEVAATSMESGEAILIIDGEKAEVAAGGVVVRGKGG